MKGTAEAQLQIEQSLHKAALDGLHKEESFLQHKKAPRNDLTTYGASLVYRGTQELGAYLEKDWKSSRHKHYPTKDTTSAPAWMLKHFKGDSYAVAFILVRTALQRIHTIPSEIRMRSSLAGAIIREYESRLYATTHPGYYKILMNRLAATKTGKDKGKILATAFRKAEMDVRNSPDYQHPDKYKLGQYCWLLLYKVLPWLFAFERIYVPGRKNPSPVACLSAQVEDWHDDFLKQVAGHTIVHTPMVIPPIPYDKNGEGSYVASPRAPIKISSYRGYPLKAIQWDAPWLSSLEALQATPWQVDIPVLSTMQTLIATGHDSLPTTDMPEVPKPPEGTTKDSNTWLEYRKQCRRREAAQKKEGGKRIGMFAAAKTALDMAKWDSIYMPQQCDFRGRVYSLSAALSPQGADYSKGLIRFARKKPLGDRGAYWLAVHMANLCGVDKVSYDERVAWTHANSDDICNWAASPQRHMGWLKADKPWQALLAAQDWKGLCDHGESYESSIPIAMDGSNNGLQHLSAILRDPIGAHHVNMTNNDKPQDVYGYVAEQLIVWLKEEMHKGRTWTTRKGTPQEAHYNTAQLARVMLENVGIDRTLLKRPTMTYAYNATAQSMGEYLRTDKGCIADRIRDGADIEGLSEFVLGLWLAQPVYKTISNSIQGAGVVMQWLSKVALILAKEGEKSIQFDNPAGFRFHQATEFHTLRKTNMKWEGKVYNFKVPDSLQVRPQKARTAFAPNLIHSLDSAHMWLTIGKLQKAGIVDYAMVHDSYGVHACDVDTLHGAIRESFVGLYDNYCPMNMLTEKYKHISLPEVPEKGTFNIQEVLNAPYFFA